MYMYDLLALAILGLSHLLFYLQLIQYKQFSWKFIIILSICFSLLLGTIVTVTGYPEFNWLVSLLFLLALGLLQQKHGLTFSQNVFFVLLSLESITFAKMVLVEGLFKLFMLSSLNLYIWTISVIHFISVALIFVALLIWHKQIQKVARFIVESRLYYFIYGILLVGLLLIMILTVPTTNFLHTLYTNFGDISYIISIILFFILLILFLISSHLAKEKLLEEQQQKLDEELLDYVEKLEVMHEELASFRHDYINVLLSLHEGIRTKNIEQIEQIYHDVIAPTSQMINLKELELVKLSRIRLPEIKSIISVKMIAAEQRGITILLDIPEKLEAIAMPLVPFIRAISILIDNAIEEAETSDERQIQIAFFEVKKVQHFVIRNSCSRKQIDLAQIYEKNYSHKKKTRGYGLFSLKRLLDKVPNATLETEFTYPYFTQIISLANKKK